MRGKRERRDASYFAIHGVIVKRGGQYHAAKCVNPSCGWTIVLAEANAPRPEAQKVICTICKTEASYNSSFILLIT